MSGPNPATLRCYTEDWRAWCAWCAANSVDPVHCTVDDLARCFHEWRAAGLSVSSVNRRKAAIGYFHRQAGVGHSVVNDYAMRAVMAELRRSARPPRGKQGLSDIDIRRLVDTCKADPHTLRGLRDRAILAVGWSCYLGRLELAAIQVADLSDRRRLPGLSDDARRAALEWVQAARIVTGPLFVGIGLRRLRGRGKPATEVVSAKALTGHSIALVIKRRCRQIGKAEARFSAHSLRNGRVAHEVRRGTDVRDIMSLARVRSVDVLVHRVGMAREP